VAIDIVNTGILRANAVQAEQLQISANSDSGSGDYIYFGSNQIKIVAGGVTRVLIGAL
jgi:hypothetical protein